MPNFPQVTSPSWSPTILLLQIGPRNQWILIHDIGFVTHALPFACVVVGLETLWLLPHNMGSCLKLFTLRRLCPTTIAFDFTKWSIVSKMPKPNKSLTIYRRGKLFGLIGQQICKAHHICCMCKCKPFIVQIINWATKHWSPHLHFVGDSRMNFIYYYGPKWNMQFNFWYLLNFMQFLKI